MTARFFATNSFSFPLKKKRLATREFRKNETDRTCSMYGVGERCVHGNGGGVLRERYHLEEQGLQERILLKRIFKEWNEGMDWIDLAQD